jgi:hypothetical protein
MNYVVKLKAPDAHRAVRDGETRFDVSFDKMRPRKSGPYEFSAFIGPDETGVFQLTFSPTETNIEPQYRVLRFLGKLELQTHREIAGKIDVGVGSIQNCQVRASICSMIFGQMSLVMPNNLNFSKGTMCSFEQACPPDYPEISHRMDNRANPMVCGCST